MKFRYWLGAATGALIATSAVAQPTDVQQPDNGDALTAQDAADIVVTGIRASLRSSAAIKRNASQIVDAVSAEDVGKFPDVNIAESLQRVTGVAIDRNGGEGQFITVRSSTRFWSTAASWRPTMPAANFPSTCCRPT